jgi:hypothetical protein
MLLLVPLVVTPLLLPALPARTVGRLRTRDLALPALAAALVLVAAFAVPAGPVAFGLTLPWLGIGAATTAMALAHGVPRLPGLLYPRHSSDLATDAALGYLGVGAVFLAFDRAGFQPLGFSPVIVLLTAIHFHVAGFGLVATGSLLARRGSRLAAFGAVGVIFGIPLTALGWTVGVPAINAVGSVVVGTAGLGVAVGLMRRAGFGPRGRRVAMVAGASLVVGLPLGIAWGVSAWLGLPFIDIDGMARVHGTLNLTGVVLATIALTVERPTTAGGPTR